MRRSLIPLPFFRTRAAGLLIAALLVMPTFATEIVAHRGASFDAPENTLASFRLGWEQRADADELDIYLSKDGHIVVLHDKTTKRTADRDAEIGSLTLAEIQALDAGSWKGPQWQGEKIPTLEQVLAIVPEGRRLFIEIKCGAEVLPELERVIRASGRKPEQLAIIGFSYPVVQQAKARLPELQVYWLASPTKGSNGLAPTADELIAKVQAAHLDGLDLDWHFAIDQAFLEKIRTAGLKLHIWTVDDPEVAKKLTALGVDGITTNRPLWLRQQLEGAQ